MIQIPVCHDQPRIEAAIDHVRAVLDGAENSNQGAEDVIVIMADAVNFFRRLTAIENTLDEYDLWLNPQLLVLAADEISCGGSGECDFAWYEYDTGAGGCKRADNSEFCPWEVAETLRGLAKIASEQRTEQESGA